MLFSLELQSAELILNRRVAGSLCAWIWKHTTKPRTNPRATTNQTNTSVVSDLNPTRKWVADLGLGYCRFAALVLGWKQSEISERARKRAQMESGWGGVGADFCKTLFGLVFDFIVCRVSSHGKSKSIDTPAELYGTTWVEWNRIDDDTGGEFPFCFGIFLRFYIFWYSCHSCIIVYYVLLPPLYIYITA